MVSPRNAMRPLVAACIAFSVPRQHAVEDLGAHAQLDVGRRIGIAQIGA